MDKRAFALAVLIMFVMSSLNVIVQGEGPDVQLFPGQDVPRQLPAHQDPPRRLPAPSLRG